MGLEDDIARVFRENVDRAPPGDVDMLARRLPRLHGIPGIYIEDENTAVIIMETAQGEKIHLPVDGSSLPHLADLIRYVLKATPSAQLEPVANALVPSHQSF